MEKFLNFRRGLGTGMPTIAVLQAYGSCTFRGIGLAVRN